MGISGRLGLGVACIGAVALVWAVSSRDPQPGPDCWRFDAGDWVAFPAGGNRPVLIVRRDTRPGTGEPVYWYRLADDSTEFVVAEAALGPRVAGLGRTWRFQPGDRVRVRVGGWEYVGTVLRQTRDTFRKEPSYEVWTSFDGTPRLVPESCCTSVDPHDPGKDAVRR